MGYALFNPCSPCCGEPCSYNVVFTAPTGYNIYVYDMDTGIVSSNLHPSGDFGFSTNYDSTCGDQVVLGAGFNVGKRLKFWYNQATPSNPGEAWYCAPRVKFNNNLNPNTHYLYVNDYSGIVWPPVKASGYGDQSTFPPDKATTGYSLCQEYCCIPSGTQNLYLLFRGTNNPNYNLGTIPQLKFPPSPLTLQYTAISGISGGPVWNATMPSGYTFGEQTLFLNCLSNAANFYFGAVSSGVYTGVGGFSSIFYGYYNNQGSLIGGFPINGAVNNIDYTIPVSGQPPANCNSCDPLIWASADFGYHILQTNQTNQQNAYTQTVDGSWGFAYLSDTPDHVRECACGGIPIPVSLHATVTSCTGYGYYGRQIAPQLQGKIIDLELTGGNTYGGPTYWYQEPAGPQVLFNGPVGSWGLPWAWTNNKIPYTCKAYLYVEYGPFNMFGSLHIFSKGNQWFVNAAFTFPVDAGGGPLNSNVGAGPLAVDCFPFSTSCSLQINFSEAYLYPGWSVPGGEGPDFIILNLTITQ